MDTFFIMIADGRYINATKILAIEVYQGDNYDTEHAIVTMENNEQFRVDDVTRFFYKLTKIQVGYPDTAEFAKRGGNYVPE